MCAQRLQEPSLQALGKSGVLDSARKSAFLSNHAGSPLQPLLKMGQDRSHSGAARQVCDVSAGRGCGAAGVVRRHPGSYPTVWCATAAGATELSVRRGGDSNGGGRRCGGGTPQGSHQTLPIKRRLIAQVAKLTDASKKPTSRMENGFRIGARPVSCSVGLRASRTPGPNGECRG